MPFIATYYHVIWATYLRSPIITPKIEKVIFDAIRHKSQELKSPIWAINSVEDHIHIAVSISPRVAPAEWVRIMKGRSSCDVNQRYPSEDNGFQWQGGYGLLTFGKLRLPQVVEYIVKQKEHHATGEKLLAYLERSDQD